MGQGHERPTSRSAASIPRPPVAASGRPAAGRRGCGRLCQRPAGRRYQPSPGLAGEGGRPPAGAVPAASAAWDAAPCARDPRLAADVTLPSLRAGLPVAARPGEDRHPEGRDPPCGARSSGRGHVRTLGSAPRDRRRHGAGSHRRWRKSPWQVTLSGHVPQISPKLEETREGSSFQ